VAERPTPSGGRRYPSELYLASRALPDLPAGLYRYAPARHALERLRDNDIRAEVIRSLAMPPPGTPDVILFLTSVFWRTAVRYGEYAYRLQALDTGALAGHALALGDVTGLHTAIHLDFADGPVHSVLRVDTARENCQAIITMTAAAGGPKLPGDVGPEAALPGDANRDPARPGDIGPEPAPPIVLPALPGPARDVLPLSAALHAASLREAPMDSGNGLEARAGEPTPGAVPAAAGIPHRYSATRGFRPDPIRADALTAILATACAGYAGDLPDTQVPLYVIASRVTDLAAGAYRYDPVSGRLAAVRTGDQLPVLAAGLTVSYPAVSEAGAVFVTVGDYERGFPRYGDRWYRMHTIGCGVVAERVCLAASALRLGSHLRCDFDPAVVGEALGLDPGAQAPVAMVLVGPPRLPLPVHVPLTLGAVPTGKAKR
jgi:SagB-type dehydrogenase family enzyme